MRGSCGARPHARGCGTNPCSARCLRHPTPGEGRERRIFARLLAQGPRCPGSWGLKKQRAPRMAPLRPGHLGAPWALWCARAPPVFGDAFWKPLTYWLDKIQQKKPSYHHHVLAVAPPRAIKTRAVSSPPRNLEVKEGAYLVVGQAAGWNAPQRHFSAAPMLSSEDFCPLSPTKLINKSSAPCSCLYSRCSQPGSAGKCLHPLVIEQRNVVPCPKASFWPPFSF